MLDVAPINFMALGDFFGITYHGDFGGGGIGKAINNLFKPSRHFIAIRGHGEYLSPKKPG